MTKDTILATINSRDKILDNSIKELVIMERNTDLISIEYLKDVKDYIINIIDKYTKVNLYDKVRIIMSREEYNVYSTGFNRK